MSEANSSGTLPINEVFTTIQGEGPMIGRPCVFVRLHHCPVQCPGCDTHYTWDGSEKARQQGIMELTKHVQGLIRPPKDLNHPRTVGTLGVVVSGGEPLLYYRNQLWAETLEFWRRQTWVQLETSGFIGTKNASKPELMRYLTAFSDVVISPKITPCLHGKGSNEHLLQNMPDIMAILMSFSPAVSLTFKFVCRDEADLAVVDEFSNSFPEAVSLGIQIMPYGLESNEVLENGRNLVPAVIKRG